MIKKSKLNAVCILAIVALGAGCRHDGGYTARTYDPDRSIATKDAATDMYGNEVKVEKAAVLTFAKGSSELTDAGRTRLHKLVTDIGVENISRVEIASWSDKGFPMTGSDLAKPDKDLADERADKINEYLKEATSLSTLRIRKYSMAETSNWLARMFRTDEAELKSVFAKEGETPMMRDDFNVIRSGGGPSKAVIVVIRK